MDEDYELDGTKNAARAQRYLNLRLPRAEEAIAATLEDVRPPDSPNARTVWALERLRRAQLSNCALVQEIQRLQEQVQATQSQVAAKQEDVSEMLASRRDMDTALMRSQRDLNQAAAREEELKGQLQRTRKLVAQLRKERAMERRHMDAIISGAAEVDVRLAEAQRQVAAEKARADATIENVRGMFDENLAATHGELGNAQHQIEALRQELADTRAMMIELQERTAEACEHSARCQDRNAQLEDELTLAREQMADTENATSQQLEEAGAKIALADAAAAALAQNRARTQALEAEVSALRAALAESAEAQDAAEQRAAAAVSRMQRLQTERDKLQRTACEQSILARDQVRAAVETAAAAAEAERVAAEEAAAQHAQIERDARRRTGKWRRMGYRVPPAGALGSGKHAQPAQSAAKPSGSSSAQPAPTALTVKPARHPAVSFHGSARSDALTTAAHSMPTRSSAHTEAVTPMRRAVLEAKAAQQAFASDPAAASAALAALRAESRVGSPLTELLRMSDNASLDREAALVQSARYQRAAAAAADVQRKELLDIASKGDIYVPADEQRAAFRAYESCKRASLCAEDRQGFKSPPDSAHSALSPSPTAQRTSTTAAQVAAQSTPIRPGAVRGRTTTSAGRRPAAQGGALGAARAKLQARSTTARK